MKKARNFRALGKAAMGNQNRNEPWRPFVGGGNEGFFWGGTSGRSW
jgi:hypothetical protein